MLDTKEVIEAFTVHLVVWDSWRLPDEQLLDLLRKVETLGNLVTALQIDATAQVEERGLHARQGCRDVAELLRSTLKIAPADAKRRVRLAQALPGLPITRELLSTGVISAQHALAIVNAVERVPAERAAEAEELVRIAMSTAKLPSSGGIRPQVIVTIPFTNLRDGVGCGETATGTALSAALVQEMVCDSDVLRAVLTTEGVPTRRRTQTPHRTTRDSQSPRHTRHGMRVPGL